MHYMLRFEIWMMDFRESYIPGVFVALKRRGLDVKKAKVYSKDFLVMILYKDRTVLFDTFDFREQSGDLETYVNYIYEQLDPWNWE